MSGKTYTNIEMSGGRANFGDAYNYGPSQNQRTLQTILESLRYDGMDHRQQMVTEAEEETFKWALEEDEEMLEPKFGNVTTPMTLKAWLTGDNGDMFCVVGKAEDLHEISRHTSKHNRRQ